MPTIDSNQCSCLVKQGTCSTQPHTALSGFNLLEVVLSLLFFTIAYSSILLGSAAIIKTNALSADLQLEAAHIKHLLDEVDPYSPVVGGVGPNNTTVDVPSTGNLIDLQSLRIKNSDGLGQNANNAATNKASELFYWRKVFSKSDTPDIKEVYLNVYKRPPTGGAPAIYKRLHRSIDLMDQCFALGWNRPVTLANGITCTGLGATNPGAWYSRVFDSRDEAATANTQTAVMSNYTQNGTAGFARNYNTTVDDTQVPGAFIAPLGATATNSTNAVQFSSVETPMLAGYVTNLESRLNGTVGFRGIGALPDLYTHYLSNATAWNTLLAANSAEDWFPLKQYGISYTSNRLDDYINPADAAPSIVLPASENVPYTLEIGYSVPNAGTLDPINHIKVRTRGRIDNVIPANLIASSNAISAIGSSGINSERLYVLRIQDVFAGFVGHTVGVYEPSNRFTSNFSSIIVNVATKTNLPIVLHYIRKYPQCHKAKCS
ncbi:MAG: hypothetical protein ACKO34_06915 [Vampirovibrionales bacterium]